MANNLVILESPGKIGAVKSYLGSNYKVIASIGHVRDLPKSTLGIDTENGFEPHYINIRGKGDLIKELKKEAKTADKIFFATDPDREGEAISWHLAAILGDDAKKAKRISFNEITKTAVKEAIKHPRNIDINLVNSQQARRILDRIVGYQISPILWKTIKSGLSAGRVQSVATKIIVEREEEIKKFIPTEYWTILANLKTAKNRNVVAHYYGKKGKKSKISDQKQADKIVAEISNGVFKVDDIKNSSKYRAPQPPFITSTLQQEASKKYNFQSQKTMKIAQSLYEGIDVGDGEVGLITYMRTDSVRVSPVFINKTKKLIEEKYGEDYVGVAKVFNNSKNNVQDAHEGIRPTDLAITPELLETKASKEQAKLYRLIYSRAVSSMMKDELYEHEEIIFSCLNYKLLATGDSRVFDGFCKELGKCSR